MTIPNVNPHSVCSYWLGEGRIICHEPITEDSVVYECAHCGTHLIKEGVKDE